MVYRKTNKKLKEKKPILNNFQIGDVFANRKDKKLYVLMEKDKKSYSLKEMHGQQYDKPRNWIFLNRNKILPNYISKSNSDNDIHYKIGVIKRRASDNVQFPYYQIVGLKFKKKKAIGKYPTEILIFDNKKQADFGKKVIITELESKGQIVQSMEFKDFKNK